MAKKKARTAAASTRRPGTTTRKPATAAARRAAKPASKKSAAAASRLAPPPARWPFLDARNFAVLTQRRVIDKLSPTPVVYVVHADDGSWQFLDGGDTADADGAVVALESMMRLDSTLMEVATLPRGWYAIRRTADDPWWPVPTGQSVEGYYSTMSAPEEPRL